MRRSIHFSFAHSPIALALGQLVVTWGLMACEHTPPPEAQPAATAQTVLPGIPLPAPEIDEPELPAPAASAASSAQAAEEPSERPPWNGPFFVLTRSSSGIYAEPSFAKEKKIGYAEEGARLPVHEELVKKDNCRAGWYRLVDGGYVCGEHGTTKLDDPRVRVTRTQPDLEAVLPYRYARNTRNGTPLYRSVPTREQLRTYEPHLFPSDNPAPAKPAVANPPAGDTQAPLKPAADDATARALEDQQRRMAALRAARMAMLGESADDTTISADTQKVSAPEPQNTPEPAAEQPEAPAKPWWQEENPELHRLSIEALAAESDQILATRMVKGFYVAVDKIFDWNKRRWIKSTRGPVAPAEPFTFAAGSEFKGVELNDEWKLPVGWVYGGGDSKPKFSIDVETKQIKNAGSLKRFAAVNLTEEEIEIAGKQYVRSVDDFWVRKRDLRITRPGPPPPEVGPGEHWVDVNLSSQTVVLFRGTEPLFATLTSTGKSNKIKEKDHSTPTGAWRVREKHITATMDGDGTAAGDLPYSIEGVPYVMYFHRAYALHAAFWHNNYGVQMSHGCVNLSPLDAKYLFFHTDPPVAEGWHGAWSSTERPGSFVVVHE